MQIRALYKWCEFQADQLKKRCLFDLKLFSIVKALKSRELEKYCCMWTSRDEAGRFVLGLSFKHNNISSQASL